VEAVGGTEFDAVLCIIMSKAPLGWACGDSYISRIDPIPNQFIVDLVEVGQCPSRALNSTQRVV
jgi:hypothetical protein